jgi:elongation factor Ts
MAITSDMIKRLREKTGAGMMDCKRALEETGGSMDAAIEHLRKKGAAVAAKRAERVAKEGMVVTRVGADGRTGVIVEVNCETDFVGRSDDFVRFADAIAQTVERHRPASTEALLRLAPPGEKTVADLMNDLLAKVGEKIDIRRFAIVQSADGVVSSYIHPGNKIGVLVDIKGITPDGAKSGPGRDVAMQIAAMNPMVIARGDVEKSIVDREMDIFRTQATNEGKPAHIVDKIAQGRLEKFYQEVCLLEQTYIKDPGKTVKDYLHESGAGVAVTTFHRYHLGEEGK